MLGAKVSGRVMPCSRHSSSILTLKSFAVMTNMMSEKLMLASSLAHS